MEGSWSSRNWLPMVGFFFIGAHVGIYHLQKAAKLSAKQGMEMNSKCLVQ